MMKKYTFMIFALFMLVYSEGQVSEDDDDFITIDTPLTFDFDKEDDGIEIVEQKKKKRKKNYFYGVKTKKGFTRNGNGESLTLELFHFLKEPVEPDNLVRDIYWYDFKRKIIRSTPEYDPEEGALLHGPYKKIMGTQVLDSGVFYFGLKHGTWMYHDKNDVLIDKEKYYKGWPRFSKVRYYDRDREKIKEIIPVEFGDKEGNYYYFFENGRIAVEGEFKWDKPVGDWVEFYPNGRRKKIIRYSKDPFSDQMPVVLREWNTRGQLVYDYIRASR